MKRREFIRTTLAFIGGAISPFSAAWFAQRATAQARAATRPPLPRRYVFLVDTYQCTGCGLCVQACKIENDLPLDANVSRTWVERYVVLKDGQVIIDSPAGGRDGFTSSPVATVEGGARPITVDDVEKSFFVPKLCNQCENPPCVQVCPVGATYQTPEGVVLVNRDWCIGCGYCVMSCPYGARFFHPTLNVADKCNFCYHRVSRGLMPACVEACPFEARRFGDLFNPEDPVAKIIHAERLGLLKEEYGTKPQVYYRGLSREVR